MQNLIDPLAQPLDLLFTNARLIDGTGAASSHGSLGVRNGLLVHATPSDAAHNTVDCNGLALAPGFIDAHTHDDAALLTAPALNEPHPKLSQGVTTVVTGNCGVSLAPLRPKPGNMLPAPLDILGAEHYQFDTFAQYLQALQSEPPALNTIALVGHTSLRVKHVADLGRSATNAETIAMQAEVQAAMQAGAWGLSTGVFYPPARAASTAEMVAVATPVGQMGGIVSMHLRNEAEGIDDALREAFFVAKTTGAELVLSHHKLMGKAQHGRSVQTLALIDDAAHTQRVCLDCYPYDASSTMLLPQRVASSKAVRITWSTAQPEAAGRMLHDLAAEQGLGLQAMAQALVPAGAIYFGMDEADVQRILAHPLTMIGSDGLAHDAKPHPRLWGSFARVLGHYSRDVGLFSLEAAVYKMTGLPAQRFGLLGAATPRGLLKPGFAADLVLFDPATIQDQATYDAPTRSASGIFGAWVNGQLAHNPQGTQHAHAGRVLRPHAGRVLSRQLQH